MKISPCVPSYCTSTTMSFNRVDRHQHQYKQYLIMQRCGRQGIQSFEEKEEGEKKKKATHLESTEKQSRRGKFGSSRRESNKKEHERLSVVGWLIGWLVENETSGKENFTETQSSRDRKMSQGRRAAGCSERCTPPTIATRID